MDKRLPCVKPSAVQILGLCVGRAATAVRLQPPERREVCGVKGGGGAGSSPTATAAIITTLTTITTIITITITTISAISTITTTSSSCDVPSREPSQPLQRPPLAF